MTNASSFDGKTFNKPIDFDRLNTQLGRVFSVMTTGVWKTLSEIGKETNDPESSISARLRDLRKEKFGGHQIDRRNRGNPANGLFEYRLN